MQHEDINHRTADHVQEKKARRHRPISNGHTGEGFRKRSAFSHKLLFWIEVEQKPETSPVKFPELTD